MIRANPGWVAQFEEFDLPIEAWDDLGRPMVVRPDSRGLTLAEQIDGYRGIGRSVAREGED